MIMIYILSRICRKYVIVTYSCWLSGSPLRQIWMMYGGGFSGAGLAFLDWFFFDVDSYWVIHETDSPFCFALSLFYPLHISYLLHMFQKLVKCLDHGLKLSQHNDDDALVIKSINIISKSGKRDKSLKPVRTSYFQYYCMIALKNISSK